MSHDNGVHRALRRWVRWVKRSLDAGQTTHGLLVWAAAVALPALVVVGVHWFLWHYSVVLTFLWSVLVLYATLGFRQFSHHFTVIRNALERGDHLQARQDLAAWKRIPVERQPESELIRHAIEHSVTAVHSHVLGVLVSFLVLWVLGFGPAGAVLFRMAHYLAQSCQPPATGAANMPSSAVVTETAARAWRVINHLPARATAMAFAVVGNFEEAVASWRQDTALFDDPNQGVVLAATAGALNVRLGRRVAGPLGAGAALAELASPDANALGREPQLAHLASLVGLVWRSVVLWLVFLALLTLANLAG